MRSFNILKISIIALVLLASSCKDWLEVEPMDKTQEDKLFSTVDGMYTALNGIYLDMASTSSYGKELSCGLTEVLAQMYSIQAMSSNAYVNHSKYVYTDKAVKATFEAIWQKAYFLIANCNNLLEKSADRKGLFAGNEYDILTGEAYALRALLHFDIFRLWGPIYDAGTKEQICIPYYTKVVPLPEPLLPAGEVLDRVLADLNKAETLLRSQVSRFYSTYVNNPKLRMNLFAVRALKARVYLYAGDKQKAYEAAYSLVGEGGEFTTSLTDNNFSFVARNLASAATDPDLIYYSEQLFCFQNSRRGELYNDIFNYQLDPEQFLAARLSVVNGLYPNKNDIRYLQWHLNPGNGKDVEFAKFRKTNDTKLPVRNTVQSMIKLSELYLILAESAETEAERVVSLDKLRVGRGYESGLIPAAEKQEWAKTLRTEYNREFYGEGQYFFFLKRNKISKIPHGSDSATDVAMGGAQYVLPLPDSEINFRK